MTQPPCYQCPDRTATCHFPGECEKYMNYRKEREAVSQSRRSHIENEEYFIFSTRRTIKQAVNRM